MDSATMDPHNGSCNNDFATIKPEKMDSENMNSRTMYSATSQK